MILRRVASRGFAWTRQALTRIRGRFSPLDRIACRHGTDKSTSRRLPPSPGGFQARDTVGHGYSLIYEKYFQPLRSAPLKLLEIGVFDGRSLKLWQEYFPRSEVFGLDIDPDCTRYADERIKILIGSQTDPEILEEIADQAGGSLDVVIDDGSHFVDDMIGSFRILFERVAPGGLYVLEDIHCAKDRNWGEVAYNRGMQLAGKQAGNDADELDRFLESLTRESNVAGVEIHRGMICFIRRSN